MTGGAFGDQHQPVMEGQRGQKRHAEDDAEFELQSGISGHLKKLRLNNAPTRVYTVDRKTVHSPAVEDYMPVDETKDRIVIYDLEAEIAQIEADETQTMYLAEIDKKVSAMPKVLLENSSSDPNTQLVLYQEPSSISIPEEKDAVRKAIIAARARVREKLAQEREVQEADLENGMYANHVEEYQFDDPDAMDIG